MMELRIKGQTVYIYQDCSWPDGILVLDRLGDPVFGEVADIARDTYLNNSRDFGKHLLHAVRQGKARRDPDRQEWAFQDDMRRG